MKKILIVLVFLSFGSIYAGGYRVALQGQRMLGMAHAGLSVFKNAETAFFNPAGIAFLDNKFSVSLGVNGIMSKVKFQNTGYNWAYETDNPTGTPFYLYFTYKYSDNINFGMAVYTPFGSSTVWNQWAGSHIVNDISLKVIYMQPSVVYKFSKYFSASASFIYAMGEVSYNKDINRYLADENGNKTNVQLESGMTSAMGYGLSIAYKPTDDFSFGVNYRSKITLSPDSGTAKFNNVPAFLSQKLTDTGFSAELPMPAELGIGFSFQATKKLLLAFDYNHTYWSAYKKLEINFDNDLPSSVAIKNYHNTSTIRMGAEYQLTGHFAVRAGYYYDETPVPGNYFSPETPSLNTDNFTFGLGYESDKLSVDLSLLYLKGEENTGYTKVYGEGPAPHKFGGDYISSALIPGIGITYSLK